MAEDSGSHAEERTEPASQRKRDEARKKGQVSRSVEVNNALALVAGLLILNFAGSMIGQQIADMSRSTFANASRYEITPATLHSMMVQGMVMIGTLVAPVAIGLLIVGVIANVAQVGFFFSFESLQPKWTKLNPFTGIKNLFGSRRSLVELAKGMTKVIVVGLVAYAALESLMSESVLLVDADLSAVFAFMTKGAMSVALKAGIAMLVLAVFDYAFQRFDFEKSLRMTKQEVKEEYKMLEGDPVVKGRIKTIQRQIAYKRMMSDVPKADVVVTNPTHLALALKYDSKKMGAPRVVAKGADLIALKIREIAAKHHVPIVEDKPLAQALYKSVDIGEEIPEKLFQAVAQVLAYIFRLRDKKLSYSRK
jgi:flagellar biosynthesis protein FlhB